MRRTAPEDLWPELSKMLKKATFIAAHNAQFDRSVLRACCAMYGLEPPELPFVCTLMLARNIWNIRPTNLPNVCDHLGIPLDHHKASSDGEACARIVLAARKLK